jgi:uncharacterized protein YecT (DUF1311 family)
MAGPDAAGERQAGSSFDVGDCVLGGVHPVAHDEIDTPKPAPHKESRPAGRMLLFGGVVAACVAGAGLGLWARPVNGEQPGAVKPPPAPVAEAPTVDRRLQVVVDDAPAPIGKPLDVLPAAPANAANAAPVAAPMAPEPQAVKRPPFGLLRVAAPVLSALALPARKPTPAVVAAPAPAAPAMQAPKPLPVTVVRTAPAPKKPAAVLRVAHAEPVEPPKKKAEAPVRLAKAQPKHAKARPVEIEVADEAPPPRPRRALLALAHVIEKVAQRHSRDDDNDQADRPRPHERKPAVREVRVSKPAARPKAAPKVERYVPPLNTKGAGPIKVTNVTTRCASPDPGEALACGDPNLTAAQRRLNRAYADAVAAGVSPTTLEQQQQRWLAARAAAAREAPWAVREVYQARIAELQDLTRDARGE